MPGKRLAIWAILVGMASATGCCRWADRWCPQHQAPAQCCVPMQCVPAQCSCPPGTVPANYGQPQPVPQSSWQRQYGAAPAGQPACCE